MKTLSSLKYTAVLLPALALGMPMTYADDPGNQRADQQTQSSDRTRMHQASQSGYMNTKPDGGFHSDDLIGTEVKNRRTDESIGEVSKLVLDKDGKLVAAIVSVGGMLGLGERDVAIEWDQIERELDGDEVTLSVDLMEGSLDSAPEYESERSDRSESDRRTGMTGTDRTGMTGTDRDRQHSAQRMGQQHTGEHRDERSTSQTAQQHAAQAGDRRDDRHDDRRDDQRSASAQKSDYVENKPARGFHADSLVGKEVKNQSSNDSVGTVSNLLLDHDGQIVAVIIGVGGLMGIGERDVAISWDQIERRVDSDDETTLWVNLSEQNLKDAPKYSSDRTTGTRR